MRFHNIRLRISLLWIPYLLLLPSLSIGKLVGWIFLMLSVHEMAHIVCAILFQYPIKQISVYPFGLAATISHIGHGSLIKETIILCAGPLMHVLFPTLFSLCVQHDIISYGFAMYLHQINASILLFNLLPIYPLDGGRLLQTFFHCFLRFQLAEKCTLLTSLLAIVCVLHFHLLRGASAWVVLFFLLLQIVLSWRLLPLARLQFYHYRQSHPTKYPPIFNDASDLYRGRRNIMKCPRGWQEEKDWLAMRFSKKNSRRG